MSMDALDYRILNSLQRDASVTNQSLANEVGLSPSACLKRVKRLRDNGVIDRVIALLNPQAIDECLYFIVEVTMERDKKDLYKRFEDRAVAAAEVKQCYQVTGASDFVLVVAVRDLDAYDRFCDSVLHADDNLRKFRSLLSRKRSKFDTSTSLEG